MLNRKLSSGLTSENVPNDLTSFFVVVVVVFLNTMGAHFAPQL